MAGRLNFNMTVHGLAYSDRSALVATLEAVQPARTVTNIEYTEKYDDVYGVRGTLTFKVNLANVDHSQLDALKQLARDFTGSFYSESYGFNYQE